MCGPTFSSSFAFGDRDYQSQTPLRTSSLFAHNSRPPTNSNTSSSNRTPLGTFAQFGLNPRPSSASP